MGFDGTEKEGRASPKCPEKGCGSSPALKGRKRLPFQLLMFSPHKWGDVLGFLCSSGTEGVNERSSSRYLVRGYLEKSKRGPGGKIPCGGGIYLLNYILRYAG